jgi:zinc protease
MASPDRSRAPAVGPAPESRLPAIRRERLANGLGLVMLPSARAPVVVLELVVGAGSARDTPERAGLADLTVHALPEGAAGLGMLEIAERLARIGGQLTVEAGHDAARLRITALRSSLDEALGLTADLVMRPSFPEEELDRLRAEREIDLLRSTDQPAWVARRTFDAELFGEDHPYGSPPEGTIAAVRSAVREAFVEFYRHAYRPANASLVVVGDFDVAEVGPKVERAFGGWVGDAVDPVDVSAPSRPGGGLVLVDRPGSAQSELRIGHVGVPYAHGDALALRVLNHLLGGAFLSRLNLNLRERRGWTYGVKSKFGFRRGPGPFTISTSVATAMTRPAIEEIHGELERLVAGPIEEAERTLAINGLTLGLPLQFQTPWQIADRVREIVIHDLPDDWWDGIQDRYRAVAVEDLERVGRVHLRPDALLIVVVGAGVEVGDDLAALGPVTHRARKPAVGDT